MGTDENYDIQSVWKNHIDEIKDADMPVERLQACEPVFEEMAKAAVIGDEDVEMWIDQIAAIDRTVTKTAIRKEFQGYQDRAQESIDSALKAKVPVDEWLKDNVKEVVTTRSTDHHAEEEHEWKTSNGSFTTAGDTHWSWEHLRRAAHVRSDQPISAPTNPDADDWTEWMMGFLDGRQRVRESEGPRTQAITDLKSFIQRSIAYEEPSEASGMGGVWMADEDQDYVGVPNGETNRICDQNGITPRALQVELQARDLYARKTEHVTLDDGRVIRFWFIDMELGEPRRFEEAGSETSTEVKA